MPMSHNARQVTRGAVAVVRCLALTTILHALRVVHLNFFVLDVEGAELPILSSIDWSRVSFDVLCIEVQSSEDTNQAIRQLLSAQVLTLLALLAQKCKH